MHSALKARTAQAWRKTTCDPCPVNTVAATGSDEAADCVSAPGYYDDGSLVQACPGGIQQELIGRSGFELCEPGTFSTATAATSSAT